ncbi:hypothetical protein MGN01_39630 [Methylobacterium gnaphalii]|uniref:Uncharacterized protein n=2 Tax=Methylobacterium gnaphalii TaxID=1010610 RepID=A0A512JQ95_9HYPH|nr:hypothetical protein MGN01_39630 [Methylobacterium gnaphalii]GLS48235.1 hypothetical protein GCM10007885_10790 [Methylobacterium gnaphalii]
MVHWHSPGIMVGYVSRFSPYQGGMDIDLEPWVTLCENALSLVTGVSQQTRSSDQQSFPIQAADKILRHTSRKTQTGLSSFGSRVAAPAFMPGEINVFSTWVWIPSNFDGSRLFGFIKIGDTYHRLGHRDADLAYRGAWQRVWLAAQIPSKLSHLQVGLAVIAGKGQTFWSTDWRASQYPIPIKSPPPSIGIRLGLRDWWSGQTAA